MPCLRPESPVVSEILLDTDDLGEAEAALSSLYAGMRLSAPPDPSARFHISETGTGPLTVHELDYGAGPIGLLAAMCLFLSTVLSAPSAVFGIGLLSYLFLKWFGSNIEMLASSGWGVSGMVVAFIYTVVPHFEFYDMSQKVVFAGTYSPVGLANMLFFVGYGAGYSALFLGLAWLVFRKKNL